MRAKIHADAHVYPHAHAGANYVFCLAAHKYRVAKTHRMAYLYKSFSAKEPYN